MPARHRRVRGGARGLAGAQSRPWRRPGDASVINIASMYGQVSPDARLYDTPEGQSPFHYGPAKAALLQLTRHLAAELGPHRHSRQCAGAGPFSRQAGGAVRRAPGRHAPCWAGWASLPRSPAACCSWLARLQLHHRFSLDGRWWMDALGDKSMNMAFLSSFRIGQQTVYPEELRERLAGFSAAGECGRRGAAAICWPRPTGSACPAARCWTATARMMPRCSWW